MTEFLTSAQAENDLMEFLKRIPSWPSAELPQPTHYDSSASSGVLLRSVLQGWEIFHNGFWYTLAGTPLPVPVRLTATRQQWEAAHKNNC